MKKIFEKIDSLSKEFDENYQQRKIKFKEWLKKECDFKFPNWIKVVLAGLLSFLLFRIFYEIEINPQKEKPSAFWTLATLIISSPVAFIIWHFRDQNITQQIENQRKDINLKEFQKIAEWVSGSYLIEDEITEKSAIKDDKQESEITITYTQQSNAQSIPTFSKRDGAVGLQIAAIHNLLPFFQGKHGDDFRRPALNLLTSAWLSLQQKDLAILETIDVLENPKEFDDQIKKIQQNAKSPVGVALTRVLLSKDKDDFCILKFPEIFPNLCLAGMDFHLLGLDKKVLSIFHQARNCQGINLAGACLFEVDFSGIDLHKANFKGANLGGNNFKKSNLDYALFQRAVLDTASLENCSLFHTGFEYSSLKGTNFNSTYGHKCKFQKANLDSTEFKNSTLSECNFNSAYFSNSLILDGTLLEKCDFSGAILYTSSKVRDSNDQILFSGEIVDYEFFYGKGFIIIDFGQDFSLDKKDKYKEIIFKYHEHIYTHKKLPLGINIESSRQLNPNWEIIVNK